MADHTAAELVDFGSISWGTLRSEDLAVAFADTLADLDPGALASIVADPVHALALECARVASPRVAALWGVDDCDIIPGWSLGDALSDLVYESLFNALAALAPEGVYFGASEGDGSDFAFWRACDVCGNLGDCGGEVCIGFTEG